MKILCNYYADEGKVFLLSFNKNKVISTTKKNISPIKFRRLDFREVTERKADKERKKWTKSLRKNME